MWRCKAKRRQGVIDLEKPMIVSVDETTLEDKVKTMAQVKLEAE